MGSPDTPADGHDRIDAATAAWQQGDCVVSKQWFLMRGNPGQGTPLPDESEVLEEEVAGLVVVTQTCDIVRTNANRPYVEVSPLVHLPEHLSDIKAARRPNFAYIPGVANLGLAADLDRTMTLTKNELSTFQRIRGCTTDEEVREFATALKRKRGRFAFPNDFCDFCTPLQDRLISKHSRASPEGAALRRLREVRVQASPSWDADAVKVMFWFIRSRDDVAVDWHEHLKKWLALLKAVGRFVSVEGQLATLDDLTASEYLISDPLDLDHLSRHV